MAVMGFLRTLIRPMVVRAHLAMVGDLRIHAIHLPKCIPIVDSTDFIHTASVVMA